MFSSGIQLYYLPAYSPDLNPIEESFSYVKSYLRCFGYSFRVALQGKDDWAIRGQFHSALASITPEMARGWMCHSGYW
jgi:DDE superfamily endonuclease